MFPSYTASSCTLVKEYMYLKELSPTLDKPCSSHVKPHISRYVPPLMYTKSSSVHNFRVPAPVEGTKKKYDQEKKFLG